MKNIIFSAKFTLTPLGVTLVNSRGREHKLPRNFLLGVWTGIDLCVLSILIIFIANIQIRHRYKYRQYKLGNPLTRPDMQFNIPGTLHCGKLSLNRDRLPTGTRRPWLCRFNINIILALRLELVITYQTAGDYLSSLCVCDFGSALPTPEGNESQLA